MEEALIDGIRGIEDHATMINGQVKGLDIIFDKFINHRKGDDIEGLVCLLGSCIEEIRRSVKGIDSIMENLLHLKSALGKS